MSLPGRPLPVALVVVRERDQSISVLARTTPVHESARVLQTRELIRTALSETVDSPELYRQCAPGSNVDPRHLRFWLIEVTQTVNQRIKVIAIKRGEAEDSREDPMKGGPVCNFGRVYEHCRHRGLPICAVFAHFAVQSPARKIRLGVADCRRFRCSRRVTVPGRQQPDVFGCSRPETGIQLSRKQPWSHCRQCVSDVNTVVPPPTDSQTTPRIDIFDWLHASRPTRKRKPSTSIRRPAPPGQAAVAHPHGSRTPRIKIAF